MVFSRSCALQARLASPSCSLLESFVVVKGKSYGQAVYPHPLDILLLHVSSLRSRPLKSRRRRAPKPPSTGRLVKALMSEALPPVVLKSRRVGKKKFTRSSRAITPFHSHHRTEHCCRPAQRIHLLHLALTRRYWPWQLNLRRLVSS